MGEFEPLEDGLLPLPSQPLVDEEELLLPLLSKFACSILFVATHGVGLW